MGAAPSVPDHNAIRAQEEAQRAREAHEAAQAEAERSRRAAEEARLAREAAQAEAERVRREAEEARIAAERAAEAAREEAQRREQALRDEAKKAAEAAEQEARRQQELAAEETRRAMEAQRAAEDAAREAAEEARRAQSSKEEAERRLREGVQPVIVPSAAEIEEAKGRIEYREGLFHFAVVGIAGSGKSSLINAFRGLRNRDQDAARTGVAETTLEIARLPDPNPTRPFAWYDVPGAGTLAVRDWQYFHDQGLYVFDALIVLFDNRFTMTDVAILRNARRFGIPCYIVRSKADAHVRNVMKEMGYSSDDEDQEQDACYWEKVEREAKEEFVSTTRQTVQDNLRGADLPDQRVYIVSNSTMMGTVKESIAAGVSKEAIDEADLWKDLWGDVYARRGI